MQGASPCGWRAGLSTVWRRPSVIQTQLCASPSIVPGRLLLSTSNKPAGPRTSRSTSLTRPSSSTTRNSLRAPGITIGQTLVEELQSLAFPLVGRGADDCPTRRLHAVLASARLISAVLRPPARFFQLFARSVMALAFEHRRRLVLSAWRGLNELSDGLANDPRDRCVARQRDLT